MGPFRDTVECGTIASIYNVVFHFVLLRECTITFQHARSCATRIFGCTENKVEIFYKLIEIFFLSLCIPAIYLTDLCKICIYVCIFIGFEFDNNRPII
jgi:hypothetical protein